MHILKIVLPVSDEFFYRADSMVIRLKSTCPAKKKKYLKIPNGYNQKKDRQRKKDKKECY